MSCDAASHAVLLKQTSVMFCYGKTCGRTWNISRKCKSDLMKCDGTTCIANCSVLCESPILTDIHFIERGTAENSWNSSWSWSFLPIHANSAEALQFLLDCSTLLLVTLLNWAVGILTLLYSVFWYPDNGDWICPKELLLNRSTPPCPTYHPLSLDNGLEGGSKHLITSVKSRLWKF